MEKTTCLAKICFNGSKRETLSPKRQAAIKMSIKQYLEPIVIISDVHIKNSNGWKGQVDELRGLWATSGTVVFNGDTVGRSKTSNTTNAEEILTYISKQCAKDGVEAVFLAGNSDYFINTSKHLLLAEGRILIMHGDVIFPQMSPWYDESHLYRAARDSVLRQMSQDLRGTLEGQLASVREAKAELANSNFCENNNSSFSNRIQKLQRWLAMPCRGWAIIRAWQKMPSMAAKFTAQYAPEAKFIIVGHTHHSGVWSVAGKVIVNTGSFGGFGKATIVRITDAELLVQKLVRKQYKFFPDKTIASFPLL